MSDEQIAERYDNPALHVEVWGIPVGDWWHTAGLVQALLTTQGFKWRRRAVKDDVHEGVIIACGPLDTPIFTIQITSIDGKTEVIANTDPDYETVIVNLIKVLEAAAAAADNVRRFVAPTADEVIEIYYRSRAAGSKVTLRGLAKRYDFNATYLSQVKRQYDDAGKWGAKSLDVSKVET